MARSRSDTTAAGRDVSRRAVQLRQLAVDEPSDGPAAGKLHRPCRRIEPDAAAIGARPLGEQPPIRLLAGTRDLVLVLVDVQPLELACDAFEGPLVRRALVDLLDAHVVRPQQALPLGRREEALAGGTHAIGVIERESVRPADERPAAPREEHPQVGVDLGDRADGAAAAGAEALLVDHNARRDVPDGIDRRAGELGQPAAGVRAERLDELPLRLGADRVEHERRLAAAAHAGEATSRCFGTSTSMFLRWCVRAPRISMEVIEHFLPSPLHWSSHVSRRSAPFNAALTTRMLVWRRRNGSPVIGPEGRPAGTPK